MDFAWKCLILDTFLGFHPSRGREVHSARFSMGPPQSSPVSRGAFLRFARVLSVANFRFRSPRAVVGASGGPPRRPTRVSQVNFGPTRVSQVNIAGGCDRGPPEGATAAPMAPLCGPPWQLRILQK